MSKLSEQLAELMAEDNYSQSSLAKAMNTPSPKLSLYLSGKSTPNFQIFISLIEFFHCSADFLLGLTDYPNRDTFYKPVQPFGIQLRKVLQIKNKSQYAFKHESGLSWSIIHNWLTGKSLPSLDNLLKVKKCLDCSVDFLLGREN